MLSALQFLSMKLYTVFPFLSFSHSLKVHSFIISPVLIQWRLQRMENMHIRWHSNQITERERENDKYCSSAERKILFMCLYMCCIWKSCAVENCYQLSVTKNISTTNRWNWDKFWWQLQLMNECKASMRHYYSHICHI